MIATNLLMARRIAGQPDKHGYPARNMDNRWPCESEPWKLSGYGQGDSPPMTESEIRNWFKYRKEGEW